MSCGGFPSAGGGGGGGNLSGTLTPDHIPYASAAHTLSDSPLIFDPMTGNVSTAFTFSVGANILLDGPAGQITTEFLHATSNSAIDGALLLGNTLTLNAGAGNVFTVDSSGNVVVAGTTDLKGIVTLEAETLLRITTLAIAGGNVAVNMALSDFYELDLTASALIQNPSNLAAGGRKLFRIRTGLGPAALTWDTQYNFGAGGAPAIDASVVGYWYLGFAYNEHQNKMDCIGPLVGPL